MNSDVGQVLASEFLKLRRAKVTWATLAAMTLATLGGGMFMWIVLEPGRAAQLGLLGKKADLAGLEATWPAFLGLITLFVGIGGLLVLSFVVAYVFGREFAEGTAKNMLAVPVRRYHFVMAKLAVAAVWWLALVTAVLAEAFALGAALGLPGLTTAVALGAVGRTFLAAGIAFLLTPPVAWVTLVGRGYMAPLGFALMMLLLGNVFSKTGWAVWFPWSVIPILLGTVGKPAPLPVGSYAVAALTFAGGIAAAIMQMRADNTQ